MSHERGPVADGRWRETLVTQQSTLTTGRLFCTPGTPPLPACLSVTRQARATRARTAGFIVSVPALRRTHTGHTATILQLPRTLMFSPCVAFLPLSLDSHSSSTGLLHACVCKYATFMEVIMKMEAFTGVRLSALSEETCLCV